MFEPVPAASPLERFGTLMAPDGADEPILPPELRQVFLDWLTELWADKALAAVGVSPRRRAIFAGLPGTGKTTLAHHLAARLGLPMLVVRPETIQAKYIGESARMIAQLFDAAGRLDHPLVLFFDEFESLAQKRMHSGHNQAAEADHNHTVNTLLARLDAHEGLVIAATNFDDQIDPAVWRRFEMHVTFPLPGHNERRRILRRYLSPYRLSRGDLDLLAEATGEAAPDLLRKLCEGIKRTLVVGPLAGWAMDCASVFGRVISAVQPHPDMPKPRLWSLGATDRAASSIAWPLSTEAPDEAEAEDPDGTAAVVDIASRRVRP